MKPYIITAVRYMYSTVCIVVLYNCMFEMTTLMMMTQATSSFEIVPPSNDKCINAKPYTIGSTVTYSMELATIDYNLSAVENNNCDTNINPPPRSPGVWFTFKGTGESLHAQSCYSRRSSAGSISYITIFSGGCNPSESSLQCVTTRTRGCNSRIIFESVPDMTYHALVDTNTVYSSSNINFVTNFSISAVQTPTNDKCVNAQLVTIGSTVTADTRFATFDKGLGTITETCGATMDDFNPGNTGSLPGVWFKFIGTGKRVIARSCYGGKKFVTIFTGGCNPSLSTLVCVLSKSRTCFSSYNALVDTISGLTYYVFLETEGAEFGELSLLEVPIPSNQNCINAQPIEIGSTVSVNGTYAKNDLTLAGLKVCINREIYDDDYEWYPGTNPGVWFTFTGNGKRVGVRSSCQRRNEYITIMQGGCNPSLSSLKCVLSATKSCSAEQVVFNTISGITYHIYLEGGIQEGKIDELSLYIAATTANDLCNNAEQITIGSTISTNTTNATSDKNLLGIGSCINADTELYPGTWYTFQGTGQRIIADACGDSYGTYITIFKGICTSDSVSSLQCVTPRKIGCRGNNKVVLKTVPGTTYHLLLENRYDTANELSLKVINDYNEDLNDVCVNARPIAINSTSYVNTTYATLDNDFDGLKNCSGNENRAKAYPGIWFKFTGTGERLSTRSCTGIITISQGGCNPSTSSIQCVIYRKESCTSESNIVFDTVPGITYHILLEATGTGVADLSLFTAPKIINEVCINAIPITIGSTETGNITYAKADSSTIGYGSCLQPLNNEPVVRLWFKFIGTGERISISTPCPRYGGYITIFQGSCATSLLSLQCVTRTYIFCDKRYIIDAIQGTVYHVLLEYSPRALETFSLSMELAPPVVNDRCINSKPISIGSAISNVDARYATLDTDLIGLGNCFQVADYRFLVAPGIWFDFTGNGERLVARSCNMITIFQGGCNQSLASLSCVTPRRNGCERERIIFNTVLGTKYHVLLESDSFVGLDLFRAPTVANDFCTNAATIAIDSTVVVDTTYATVDSDLIGYQECTTEIASMDPGTWYTFIGNGERMFTSSNSCLTTAVYITIFQGGCNLSIQSLQCVRSRLIACNRYQKSVFNTVSGTRYHILLETKQEGVADLSLSVAPKVVNDLCANAIPITIGTKVATNVSFADIDDYVVGIGDCIPPSTVMYPGVWYMFTGTGERLTTQCISSLLITIFQGGCSNTNNVSNLQCVLGRTNSCTRSTFNSIIGVKYYVLVEAEYDYGSEFSIVTVLVPPTKAPSPTTIPPNTPIIVMPPTTKVPSVPTTTKKPSKVPTIITVVPSKVVPIKVTKVPTTNVPVPVPTRRTVPIIGSIFKFIRRIFQNIFG